MKDFKHDQTFEYRVTYAEIPEKFPDHSRLSDDLAKISPKPPKGGSWQLAGSVAVGRVVFYHWEREAREPRPAV